MNINPLLSLGIALCLVDAVALHPAQSKSDGKPVPIKPIQKITPKISKSQWRQATQKLFEASRSEYLRMNDQLKKEWEKAEPKAANILAKNGMKAADLQLQARKTVRDLPQGPSKVVKVTAGTNVSAAWKNAGRLADHTSSLFTSSDPNWRSHFREDLGRINPNWVHFSTNVPVQQAAPPAPQRLNTNGLMSRTFTPPYDWIYPYNPPDERSGPMNASAQISQVGADYHESSLGQNFSVPPETRSIDVRVDNFTASVFLRNLVLWGYGSAEVKLTLYLQDGADDVASHSLSLDSSVFVIAGYKQDVLDLRPSIALHWTGTPHSPNEMAVHLELECWAGGGPVGTDARSSGQLSIPTIQVVAAGS